MAFAFGRLNSLVAQVQSTIKTVESSIDRAMGTDEQSLAAQSAASPSSSAYPAPSSSSPSSSASAPSGDAVHRFVNDTTGDFFSSFGGDGFTAPIVTPTKASHPSSAALPSAASVSSWEMPSLSSAASRLTNSILPASAPTGTGKKSPVVAAAVPIHTPPSQASSPTIAPSQSALPPPVSEHKEDDGWTHADLDDGAVEVESADTIEAPRSRADSVKDAPREERKEERLEYASGEAGWADRDTAPRGASSRALSSSGSLDALFPSQSAELQTETTTTPLTTPSVPPPSSAVPQLALASPRLSDVPAPSSLPSNAVTAAVPVLPSAAFPSPAPVPHANGVASATATPPSSSASPTPSSAPPPAVLPPPKLSTAPLVVTTTPPHSAAPSPTAASAAFTPTSHSSVPASLLSPEEVAKRLETAELISSKLNRLVKIRELQLEKLQLENASANQQISVLTAQLELKVNEVVSVKEAAEERSDRLKAELAEERRKAEMLREDRDALRRVKDSSEASEGLVKAKDAQIDSIMKEGQALMQKQANLESIIKKLRKEIAEKDALLAQADKTREELGSEHERRLKAEDSVAALTQSIEEVSSKNNELLAQLRSMEANTAEYALELERAKDESRARAAQVESLSAELAAMQRVKSEAQQTLESLQHTHTSASAREEALVRSLNEVQLQLKREEEQRTLREESLDYDLRVLRDQLREAERRNEELAGAVPAATRPLLRQIDSLQANMREQGEVWGKMEGEMRARVKELDMALMKARQEKNSVEESKHRLELEVAEREMAIKALRDRLATADTTARSGRKLLEQATERLAEVERHAEHLQHTVDEQQTLRAQLEERLKKSAEERRQADARFQQTIAAEIAAKQSAEQQLEQAKANNLRQQQHSTPPDEPSAALPSPTSSALGHPIASPSSVIAFSAGPGYMSSALHWTTVQLRSDLRQKDGELQALRSEVRTLERVRLELSEQLVEANGKITALAAMNQRVRALEGEVGVLRGRYEAALQLIGEKEDELEERDHDLSHLKLMFRTQVEQLVQQSEDVKKGIRPPQNGRTPSA